MITQYQGKKRGPEMDANCGGCFFFFFTTETGRESERQVDNIDSWRQELDSRAYQV